MTDSLSDRVARKRHLERVNSFAESLLDFSQAVPPEADLTVGGALAERIAEKVTARGGFHQILWLIEILGDCSAHLAAGLRDTTIASPVYSIEKADHNDR